MIRLFFALYVLFAGLPAPVLAQTNYPEKPVRIINPFPPGSPVEFIGRLVAERLSRAWGRTVLVLAENKALFAEIVKKAGLKPE
jgi:tripartite-type tricarboxylate transporter receptor subunit TctC